MSQGNIYPNVYKPLDYLAYEFRLLTIHQRYGTVSTSNEPLVSCSLNHRSLLQPPIYYALSYVWGDSRKTRPILVNGYVMQVTVNLEAALQELRAGGYESVWVDALTDYGAPRCINQSDEQERGLQVTRMSQIYSRARTITVWFGLKETADLEQYYKGSLGVPDAPTVRQLLKNPFWKRVWIIQEVAKGNRVEFLGSARLPWDDVIAKFLSLDVKESGSLFSEGVRDILLALRQFRTFEQEDKSRMSLLEALLVSRRSLATEPRDKIYAVLGMTSDGAKIVPTPNYLQSVQDVYIELTRSLIKDGQLSCILLARKRSAKFPSWASDWSTLYENTPPWIENWIKHRCASRRPTHKLSFEGNTLCFEGLGFDTVISLSACTNPPCKIFQETVDPAPVKSRWHGTRHWPAIEVRRNLWNALTLCENFNLNPPLYHSRSSPDSQEFIMAMFAILCVGGWQFSSPEKKVFDQWLAANEEFLVDGRTIRGWAELFILDSESSSEFKRYKRLRDKETGYFHISPSSDEEKALLRAVKAVSLLVSHQMRLVTTVGKRVMWVYHKARAGDRIMVLQNCMYVVLRPAQNWSFGSSAYEYIGEALDASTFALVRGDSHHCPDKGRKTISMNLV